MFQAPWNLLLIPLVVAALYGTLLLVEKITRDGKARITKAFPSERLKLLCCVCGVIIREGRTINGRASHGFCGPCENEYRKENDLPPREKEENMK
jgi:hypothetical protein